MKRVLDKLAEILITVSGILFFVIFIVNTAEVISRSFFNNSLLWVSDLSVICVVWMICLAISVCVYYKEHLVMEALANRLPLKIRIVVSTVILLMSITFFLVLFYTGLQTAASKMALIFPSTQWPLVWSYSAIPAFAILSVVFMIPRLISLFKTEAPKKDVSI